MTKLFPDDIANLRALGYSVSSEEGQTYVESQNYVIEEDFGRWFLYTTRETSYEYLDEFDSVFKAVDYIKDVLNETQSISS